MLSAANAITTPSPPGGESPWIRPRPVSLPQKAREPGGSRTWRLLIETSRTYGRDLLRGIKRFMSEHEPWSIFTEMRALESPVPPWLVRWRGDGILTRTNSQAMADAIRKTGVPAVELRARSSVTIFPSSASTTAGSARWSRSTCWSAVSGTSASTSWLRKGILRSDATTSSRRCAGPGFPATSIRRRTDGKNRCTGRSSRRPWPVGSPVCPSRSGSWPAPINSASGCWTPAAGRAWPCPRRWPWSAWRTTSRSVRCPRRPCRASSSTANRSATRRPRCWPA